MFRIIIFCLLVSIGTRAQKIGDVKQGVQTSDHNGWYLMNGRAASTLGAVASGNAASIGVTTLVNMADRFVKHKDAGESLGSTGGSTSLSLTHANMPNYSITSTLGSAGSHSHSWTEYNDRKNPGGNGTTGSSYPHYNNLVSKTTTTSGDHFHNLPNIPSGGSGSSISVLPSYLAVNYFVYLGE